MSHSQGLGTTKEYVIGVYNNFSLKPFIDLTVLPSEITKKGILKNKIVLEVDLTVSMTFYAAEKQWILVTSAYFFGSLWASTI